MLEPREYGLVISVFYSAEGENFTNVVFNSTFGIVDSDEPLDMSSLFTYIGLIGVAGLVGFLVYNSTRSVSKKQKRVEYGTQKQTVLDNEWLEGTAAAQRSPKTTPRSPKSSKTKSS